MSRRDWQLQQLGIVQLILRHPIVLQGEITISIPKHVRLIIITDKIYKLENTLVYDVLRALQLKDNQILQVTPEHVAMLLKNNNTYNSWQIGITTKILTYGCTIFSPSLDELKNSPEAKSELWQQICKYKHIFSS